MAGGESWSIKNNPARRKKTDSGQRAFFSPPPLATLPSPTLVLPTPREEAWRAQSQAREKPPRAALYQVLLFAASHAMKDVLITQFPGVKEPEAAIVAVSSLTR